MKAYPKIVSKHRQHLVRQHIPPPLRKVFGGRKMFRAYLPTNDPHEAYILSKPIVMEWEARIAEAAQANQDATQAEIMRLRLAYEEYRDKPLDHAGRELFDDIMAFLFQRLGGVTPVVQRLVLSNAKGNVEQALKAVERSPQAIEAARQIVGLRRPRHCFVQHIDEYERTADVRSARTRRARATYLRGFALAMVDGDASKVASFAWEDITPEKVQKWLNARIEQEAKGTTYQHLQGLQSYWNWACHHNIAGLKQTQRKTGVFYEVRVGYRKRDEPVAPQIKLAFTPLQVVELYHAAQQGEHYQTYTHRGKTYKRPLTLTTALTDVQRRDVNALLHCMVIKAFTTVRLGAICNIKVEDIQVDEETRIRYIYVPKDKTSAGSRMVPIHSKLAALIDWLVADALQAGRMYLIDSPRDRYDAGGHRISIDFSALKTAMGYSKAYSEHCIRKTVQAMWERARIPLKARKAIIGHVIKDITEGVGYGKYGSKVPLPELKEAIDVIEYPGSFAS